MIKDSYDSSVSEIIYVLWDSFQKGNLSVDSIVAVFRKFDFYTLDLTRRIIYIDSVKRIVNYVNLTELIFKDSFIDDIECVKLLDILVDYPSVKKLDLRRNYLRHGSCKEFSRNFNKLSLEELKLSHNNLGNKGCNFLTQDIKSSKLKKLRLNCVYTKDDKSFEFLRNICYSGIQKLTLRSQRFSDKASEMLSLGLKHSSLTDLKLFHSSISGRSLDLLYSNIVNSGVKKLSICNFNFDKPGYTNTILRSLPGTTIKILFPPCQLTEEYLDLFVSFINIGFIKNIGLPNCFPLAYHIRDLTNGAVFYKIRKFSENYYDIDNIITSSNELYTWKIDPVLVNIMALSCIPVWCMNGVINQKSF